MIIYYMNYYMNDDVYRIYIGFWKNGKQEGIGKYINQKSVRYGMWAKGERIKWFDSDQEALENIPRNQQKYAVMMKSELIDICQFLS